MECSESRKLLTAHVDGQLDFRPSLELEGHLESCADCRAQFEMQKALRNAIGQRVTYFRAPAALAARIDAALPSPSAAAPPRAKPRMSPPARAQAPAMGWWRWPNLAAGLVALVAVAWTLGLVLNLPNADERLTDEIVGSHVRSLLADHAVDVASSDRHTVKPWFNGKLDFAPPVRDLANDGFPLVGGRLDYIDHRPVAALVYRHAQHTINVFVLPQADKARDTPLMSGALHGFRTVHWSRDGLAFWVVSDVDAEQLTKLSALLRDTAAPP